MFPVLGWALAEITTNIAAPELDWTFSVNVWSKYSKILPGVAKFRGLLIVGRTSAGGHLGREPSFAYHPSLASLACLALACLAIHRLVPASLALPAPCSNDTWIAKQAEPGLDGIPRIGWDTQDGIPRIGWILGFGIGLDFPKWSDWSSHGSK